MSLVVIGAYPSDAEAEMGRAILQANGISSIILRDDAGGMLPSLHLLAEVRLAVNDEDAQEAREILEGTESEGDIE
jgi:hypothetical protein